MIRKLTMSTLMLRILFFLMAVASLALALALLTSTPVESHQDISHNPPSLTATQPAALHTQHFAGSLQTVINLRFTGQWSQPVAVPQRWQLSYICDEASPVDQYDVADEHGIFAKHASLTCDNQWHSIPFNFRDRHTIQVAVSRPVDATVVY